MPNAFVDTNIVVYAADVTKPTPRKSVMARDLLRQRNLRISVQVLNEFIANARNPKKLNLNRKMENEWIKRLLLFPVGSLTADRFIQALEIHARYQISHWDALIVASALHQDCRILYSEDLNPNQDYGGITVLNPFI